VRKFKEFREQKFHQDEDKKLGKGGYGTVFRWEEKQNRLFHATKKIKTDFFHVSKENHQHTSYQRWAVR
jgi:hypothetical protein